MLRLVVDGDPLDIESWSGALAGVTRAEPSIQLFAPLRRSSSGTGAFQGLANDGRTYWFKTPNNPQGVQSIVNEVVAHGVGRLLGAPLRPTTLCAIGPLFDGWPFAPGYSLHPSTAHASLHLESAIDSDQLLYRDWDDNRRRHVRLLTLWDLLMGTDPQWLYDMSDDRSTWSFDHGFWFGGESGWTRATLQRDVGQIWEWEDDFRGLDFSEFGAMAERLLNISPDDLVQVLAQVPLDWGIPASELESLGWFIFARLEALALRLRPLAGLT